MKKCPTCKSEYNRTHETKQNWDKKVFCSKRCGRLGRKLSPLIIRKVSQNRKGKGVGNKNSLGFKHTDETRIKLSIARQGNDNARGEKNWRWKGGISIGENRKSYYVKASQERRTRKLDAKGTHTINEWEETKVKHSYTCLLCLKQEPEIKLTEDHITPLSKGGSDYISNIQPLCRSCNSKKSNKLCCSIKPLQLLR